MKKRNVQTFLSVMFLFSIFTPCLQGMELDRLDEDSQQAIIWCLGAVIASQIKFFVKIFYLDKDVELVQLEELMGDGCLPSEDLVRLQGIQETRDER